MPMMPNLQCTQKLLKILDIRKPAPPDDSRPEAGFGDWYAHLLVIARQKALLFTQEQTLYSFAVLGLRVAALRNITELFLEHLQLNLRSEQVPEEVIARLVKHYQRLTITSTDNRSVVGSMNDLATHLRYHVLDADWTNLDLLKINQQLNHMPHKPLGWKFAIEALSERLFGTASVPGRPDTRVFLN